MLGCAVRAQPVDESVVRSDKRNLHLTHEDVRVVARVADKGGALLIAGNVVAGFKQLRRITALV